MKKKAKVVGSHKYLHPIPCKVVFVHTVPMVTVRGYISDSNKINKQIKDLEIEIERERKKLYGLQKRLNSKM